MKLTDAGPSAEWIIREAENRQRGQGLVIAQMRAVRDTYNGDVIIPLPEMDKSERPAVANIVAQGLDQLADRIASTMPNLSYPPLRPGIQRSEDLAETRARANLGWWATNRMQQKMRRRARHIVGYSVSPMMLSPDPKKRTAKWSHRDPLNTFPGITDDPDEITPPDCIFKFSRSYGWLKDKYPDEISSLYVGEREPSTSAKFEVVEYVDDEVLVLIVLGSTDHVWEMQTGKQKYVELHRLPNRAGVCPAVTPGRITLDRRKGQFDQAVGMYMTQAKLQALELIAIERGIFPDMVLVSHPGNLAQIVGGKWEDGRSGVVNVIQNGEVQQIAPVQGIAASQMIDRLERNQRVTGGIAPEMGGESQSNVRTGKRGDAILSAVVDAPVQAAQEMLAQSLQEENKIAVAIVKGYFGGEKRTFYVPSLYAKMNKGNQQPGHVDYVPNEVFEDDNNIVTYPMAGADANGLTIAIGQRIGLGTMSKHTGMELDPMIENTELEKRRVNTEAIEAALLASIQQQAQAGAIAPHDLARINMLVFGEQMSLAEAVDKVHQEAQQRQATAAAPPDQEAGEVASPQAQPGLAQPGVGAEQPPAPDAIQGPDNSQVNLATLLQTMRRTQRQSPAETGAA